MSEKETAPLSEAVKSGKSNSSDRIAGPPGGGAAGLAIGDQGTTENPQGGSGGGGGGGGGSHGHLFGQAGELPTSPEAGTADDASGLSPGGEAAGKAADAKKGPNAVNVKLA